MTPAPWRLTIPSMTTPETGAAESSAKAALSLIGPALILVAWVAGVALLAAAVSGTFLAPLFKFN